MAIRASGRISPLLTDLYELTMAYGYWRLGRAEHEAVFQLIFRQAPFDGQYAIAAGLAAILDYLEGLRFEADDLEYLGGLQGHDGRPLFDDGFLRYLANLRFQCDVDAIPEGVVVFANEPLVRVRGSLLQAQLVETALLTLINFPTLIATKASRVCRAAGDDTVLEFGLRRAQGIDGGLTGSRAAYIGGCHATSNVLAGQRFGIPVRGTHAHSWVMSFDDELESFRAYAQAMPNNAIFLVDTYNTVEGVRKAIEVGRQMKSAGHRMLGVRLDSGDLGQLSITARRMLDEAGLAEALIVASGDLDEYSIERLKRAGSRIDVWGVGTKLATAFDQPALGGVYKLAAVRPNAASPWSDRLKLSEDGEKSSDPGALQVRRFFADSVPTADMIYAPSLPSAADNRFRVPQEVEERHAGATDDYEDLLIPVFRGGRRVHDPPSASAARQRAIDELARMPPQVTRLHDSAPFPVGWEVGHQLRKKELIAEYRGRR